MNELLEALRSEFGAEVAKTHTPTGQHHVQTAERAVKHAAGQLELLRRGEDFTEAHAKALAAAAAALHAAASCLERTAQGVTAHLETGVSFWAGAEGQESPVLV